MNFFSIEKQQALLEDLLMLLNEGVSVTGACEWMRRNAVGKQALCLDAILLSIAHGQSLAEGLQGYYPEHIMEVIRAGEQSGMLLSSLRSAIDALATRSQIRYTLQESLSYPLLVLVMGLGVLVFLKHTLLDSFVEIVPLIEWPLHAQLLIDFANALESYWWIFLIAMTGFAVFVRIVLHSYVGHLRTIIDRLPLLSVYRHFIAAHFMQTLSMLIANGMMLKSAIHTLKQTAPPYLLSHLSMMEYRLGLGSDRIGDVLNTGLIQDDDIRRLQLIMETRSLEKALSILGQNAIKQGERRVKQTSQIVAYGLLLLAGFLALAMIISVYDVGMRIGVSIN